MAMMLDMIYERGGCTLKMLDSTDSFLRILSTEAATFGWVDFPHMDWGLEVQCEMLRRSSSIMKPE
jgi:hypothetical protein